MGAVVTIVEGFLRALFPEACPVCGAGCERPGPCDRHRWRRNHDACRCGKCAARLPRGIPDGTRCAACARKSLRLGTVVALGDYCAQDPLRDWVLALKHGGRVGLARPLGIELARHWERRFPGAARPILVPVPLHALRRLERGYDQANLLARHVSEELQGQVCNALSRTRWTAPQGSALESREANVSGAFGVRRKRIAEFEGQHVWLVDDVLTTGATLGACARVLRRAGARQVSALVVARAARGGQTW